MRIMWHVFEPIWHMSYRHMAPVHMNYGFARFVCYCVVSFSSSCSVPPPPPVFPPQNL